MPRERSLPSPSPLSQLEILEGVSFEHLKDTGSLRLPTAVKSEEAVRSAKSRLEFRSVRKSL